MTSITALALPTRLGQDSNSRPIPWRKMAWVTWRQHRAALISILAFTCTVAMGFLILGLRLRHAHTAAIACHPTGSAACYTVLANFNQFGGILALNGLPLQVVPPFIGAFVGAPVLAREFASGTFRFAWTQGFGRWRWTLAKCVGLGAALATASGAISALAMWSYQPYFASGNHALNLNTLNPLSPGVFDTTIVDFISWTLLAFAVAVTAGMLIRKVVPTIVTTLVVYVVLAFATAKWLRMHYLTPLVIKGLNLPTTSQIVSQWGSKSGRVVFTGPPTYPILRQYCPAAVGQDKVFSPSSGNPIQCMVQHGFTFWTSYQPASRFWAFQLIEGGWLLTLSLLLIAGTVWVVRRRAA